MVELLSKSKPRARKVHRCNYCNGEIMKGEVYIYSKLVNEGGLYTWKSHTQCQTIAEKLEMFDSAEDGLTEEMFCENIREEYEYLIEYLNIDSDEQPEKVDFQEKLRCLCEHHLQTEPEGSLI